MSNPWDRFDCKVVLGFTGLQERIPLLKAELERIGMPGAVVDWNVPNPYETFNFPFKNYKCSKWLLDHKAHMSTTLGHYRIVREALDLGQEHILVMEDDVRFLNDIDLLNDIVASLPDDYDLALFDHFCPGKVSGSKEYYEALGRSVKSGHWGVMPDCRSAGCYALSRRGMDHFIRILQSPAVENYPLLVVDNYWGDYLWQGYKRYFAYPNAAIQVKIGDPGVSSDLVFTKYELSGIRRSNYGD